MVQRLHLGDDQAPILHRLHKLKQAEFLQRLAKKDTSLWSANARQQALILNSLGWVDIAEGMRKTFATEIQNFVEEIRALPFEHIVCMGMGGSSLTAAVFAQVFARACQMDVRILDSTDPLTVQKIELNLPLEKTLFIVASKTGTTIETVAFKNYFFARLQEMKGDKAGENFVAITDPGTILDRESRIQNFRKVFSSPVDVGGRYSALSVFGLVPAALMGLPVSEILERVSATLYQEDALLLGATLGEMALRGKNKISLQIDPAIHSVGLWVEQLLAESTGKESKGLIPLVDEPLATIENFEKDRLFVQIKLKSSPSKPLPSPSVTIELDDERDLGQEFYRWEIATAVAGSILEINPFDQPHVQASKDYTNAILADMRVLDLPSDSLDQLPKFLEAIPPKAYLAFMAFLPESQKFTEIMKRVSSLLLAHQNLASTFGYGPRFLHSTGQLHKGGPASVFFIQFTADSSKDLPIPQKKYSFAYLLQAQAAGDRESLRKEGRIGLFFHLGTDPIKGLQKFEQALKDYLFPS